MCLCCQTNQKKKVCALVKWNQGARVSGKHTELQQNKTKKKEKQLQSKNKHKNKRQNKSATIKQTENMTSPQKDNTTKTRVQTKQIQ